MAETARNAVRRETDLLERAKQRLPGGVLGTSRYADGRGLRREARARARRSTT